MSLSVRGLATALTVLRGALVRTGRGALIVGAGEPVYQFTRLVSGTGGFREAMSFLKDVAVKVRERFRMRMAAAGDAVSAMFFDLKADAASGMQEGSRGDAVAWRSGYSASAATVTGTPFVSASKTAERAMDCCTICLEHLRRRFALDVERRADAGEAVAHPGLHAEDPPRVDVALDNRLAGDDEVKPFACKRGAVSAP